VLSFSTYEGCRRKLIGSRHAELIADWTDVQTVCYELLQTASFDLLQPLNYINYTNKSLVALIIKVVNTIFYIFYVHFIADSFE